MVVEQIPEGFKMTEIGLLPEEWEVVRFEEIAQVRSGGSAPQGDKYFNGINPFIRVQHIEQESDNITKWDLITNDAVKECRLKLFPKGTIVFPKSGASIYLEKRAMLPMDAYIVSHLCAINSDSQKVNQKYLFFALKNIRLSKEKADGYPTLNLTEVKKVKIPFPPLPEQQKIARILSAIDEKIQAEENKKKALESLFRTLLSFLMTGKIRVKDLEI